MQSLIANFCSGGTTAKVADPESLQQPGIYAGPNGSHKGAEKTRIPFPLAHKVQVQGFDPAQKVDETTVPFPHQIQVQVAATD